jgi:hypothetical protein
MSWIEERRGKLDADFIEVQADTPNAAETTGWHLTGKDQSMCSGCVFYYMVTKL